MLVFRSCLIQTYRIKDSYTGVERQVRQKAKLM